VDETLARHAGLASAVDVVGSDGPGRFGHQRGEAGDRTLECRQPRAARIRNDRFGETIVVGCRTQELRVRRRSIEALVEPRGHGVDELAVRP
jgi:hypothetical protein